MNYLLDTHTFIWALLDTKKLSEQVLEIIKSKENEIFVSAVSYWEISLKIRIGKFDFRGLEINKLPDYAGTMGFPSITLSADEACSFADLPLYEEHKDPFDRMLIWQAIKRKLVMISKDACFSRYKEDGLKIIW